MSKYCLAENGLVLAESNQALSKDVTWTPAYITTIGWYDPSDASTINLSTGDNVSQIDDKSGNDYHLTQAPGNQPRYTGTINGLNILWFSNTFDLIERTGIPDIDCTEVCIVSIGESKAPGDYPACGSIFKTDNTDRLDNRLLCNDSNGRSDAVWKIDDTTANLSTTFTTDLADDIPFVISTYYDGSDTVVRVNGGAQTDTNTGAPDGATFTINHIRMGRTSNTPRNYQGEMVILNTADIDTIEKCEGYLAWKWGTVDKLPSNHPYKNRQPVAN